MSSWSFAMWGQVTKALRLHRSDSLIYDAWVALWFAALVASLLHPNLLNADTLPTGGDTASHVLYAKIFQEELLTQGRLTGWMPEVFAGFPVMSYYFPLPFMAAAGIGQWIGFASGLKWAMVLPSLLLPGTVFAISRHAMRLPNTAAWCAALGSLAFLLHEQNAIWGGNLLSVLAGEFAYSWGMWIGLMAWTAWWHAIRQANTAGAWILPAVLEALTGLCHGYSLLWVGSASCLLVLSGKDFRTTATCLVKGHLAAFALLGGWLWPLLEMHRYTIPNDATTPLDTWSDLLPEALWPVVVAGGIGLCWLAVSRRFSATTSSNRESIPAAAIQKHQGTLWFAALSSLWAVCASVGAERVGLLDVRFLPLAWIVGAISCGWFFGLALHRIGTPAARFAFGIAALCALMAWLAPRVKTAPSWAQWNHSGLEVKPQWQVLSGLFPAMTGALNSPRLLFEHDPSNEDLGSTRVLESLPMFLGGRPVLEGLYMESALLGPAIYQLQSEVSIRPSSPLVRFPSGELDPEMAAIHMTMLNTSQVLLRSKVAVQRLTDSGLFEVQAASGSFTLLGLKGFSDALVDATPRAWSIKPQAGWMLDSYRWFRSARQMHESWPVYANEDLKLNRLIEATPSSNDPPTSSVTPNRDRGSHVKAVELSRHRLRFQTEEVGKPHLIRMAYHPRWKLKTDGRLLLAAPGFMLVVPEEKTVELVYGTTLIGRLGEFASLTTLAVLVLGLKRRARTLKDRKLDSIEAQSKVQPSAGTPGTGWRAGAVAMASVTALLIATSPGIAYHDGWEAFRAGKFSDAAASFHKAYEGRRSLAGKEEALFWSAKAAHAAGEPHVALQRYTQLTREHYGHWVAESLHEIVALAHRQGDSPTGAAARKRLLEEFPRSTWSRKVESD